jgi:TonB family protein
MPEEIVHHQRQKKNSAKVNMTFSLIFHLLLIGAAALWAAHEGILGNQAKKLAEVFLVKKEKPPEPKPPEPKPELPKENKPIEKPATPVATPAQQTAPPPAIASSAAPAIAPAADGPAAMDFSDGAKTVVTSATEAKDLQYKALMEDEFRSNWKKPGGVDDSKFVAEVEVSISPAGQVTGSSFLQGSGNGAWDNSVKQAVAETKSFVLPPPGGFPSKVVVRFDAPPDVSPILQ